ncbi:GNAT family N-acetyltransferase [Caldisalinibacter kiritimatiensis]|uniref:N-acetyltransferase domain-containing protein n=1 Tax=Caldisalinibacter kiritimatiensis TaxID=1304284 RepID=R1CVR8_9FIRM|nr:GNAT family N-acetyltransferase [Caldisalinibacter kiritimatiensis]EOD00734.1 hypothetical protein L21TH_1186 [Caldisalinibacter kiritimatiensis]
MIDIIEVKDKKGLKAFIDLPWELYKDDPNWVPPLKHSMYKTLKGINNPLFMCGPHTFFLAYKDNKPIGRILVGINEKLNKEKNKKEGYISLFESINDKKVAFSLLDQAINWLKERGMNSVTGPVSPTNGDDNRGLLVKGFDGPPVLMNSYNPSYYPEFFDQYGFVKDIDLLAYYFDPNTVPEKKFKRVVEYAMKKFDFRVDKFNFKNLDREIKDMKKVLDVSMPESWEHLTPPSLEELNAEVNALKSFADPDLLYMARSNKDNEPIGFVIALPDYNQVLKKLNGKLLPFGFLKYLWYKHRITGMRIFVQFVVPKFRNKAVNGAIFYKLMVESKRKGYTYGEGSTIGEMNIESRRSVEGAGGQLYRIYRLYKKDI